MTTVAFLIDRRRPDLTLGPDAADRLARLGVTEVAIFRDQHSVCVVLEGWALEASATRDVAALIGATDGRTLRPVMQTALRPVTEEA